MPFVSYNCPTNTDSQNNEKIFIKKSLSKLVLHFTVGAERELLFRYTHIQKRTHVEEAKLLNHRLILTCQQIIFLKDEIKKHKQIHLFT